MRTADIYVFGKLAGTLTENDDGKFSFLYNEQYLNDSSAVAVSCTMPLRSEAYASDALFPFFDGLIHVLLQKRNIQQTTMPAGQSPTGKEDLLYL